MKLVFQSSFLHPPLQQPQPQPLQQPLQPQQLQPQQLQPQQLQPLQPQQLLQPDQQATWRWRWLGDPAPKKETSWSTASLSAMMEPKHIVLRPLELFAGS